MVVFTLASTWYWSLMSVIAMGGVGLIVSVCFKPRRWFWKLLFGMSLIVGPSFVDLTLTRMIVVKESPKSAWVPTMVMIYLLDTEDTGV